MVRVLMSGASGFIGSRVAALLREQGAQITTVGRNPGGHRHFAFGAPPWSTAQWVKALAEAEPDIVFHLAGAMRCDGGDLVQANVGLACGLLAALRELDARPDLIFAGSAAEYGSSVVDGVPIQEDLACAPRGAYGATKLAQTCAALAFAEQTGSRVLVARIFNPVGPDMPSHLVFGDFARQIAAMSHHGGCLVTGDIDVARDFLDIDHLAAMLVALGRNPSAKGIVNVCSGVPTVIRRLLECMIARSGKTIEIRVDPSRLRAGEPRVLFGSTSRLASFLPPKAEIEAAVIGTLTTAARHTTRDYQTRMLA